MTTATASEPATTTASTSVTGATRFHLSLNVSSLPRAVEYFSKVFGQPPAKARTDYAKFELESPPVVLSLAQNAPEKHGSLNHLGFRYPDMQTLVGVQERLELAGLSTKREEGVECCYAKQTKFWLHDFDQRLWEFYILDGDIDHRGAGQSQETIKGASAETAAQETAASADDVVAWQHRMYSPFELPASKCDEILLRGTFNEPIADDVIAARLAQSFEALKDGGKLTVHVLTSEAPVSGTLQLPGPAAYVKHTPVRQELMRAIEAAGFRDLQLATFRSGACFEHDGQPLRETLIVAYRPEHDCGATCVLVFKGPFTSVTDDSGYTWHRGLPTTVPLARWETLQQTAIKDLFVEIPSNAPVSHCGVKK